MNHIENLHGEIWKNVDFLPPNILVSSKGRVKELINMNEERLYKLNVGEYVTFSYRSQTHRVHRLVASAFLDNPKNCRIVHHINGDKHDNRVENLAWESYRNNSRESYVLGGVNSVRIYCKELDIVFGTLKSAELYTKIPAEIISSSTAKGFPVAGLTFIRIDSNHKLTEDHNIFYLDIDTACEVAMNSNSVEEMYSTITAKFGKGVKLGERAVVVIENNN